MLLISFICLSLAGQEKGIRAAAAENKSYEIDNSTGIVYEPLSGNVATLTEVTQAWTVMSELQVPEFSHVSRQCGNHVKNQIAVTFRKNTNIPIFGSKNVTIADDANCESAVNTILDLLSREDMEKIVNNLSARYGLSNNRMYNIDVYDTIARNLSMCEDDNSNCQFRANYKAHP